MFVQITTIVCTVCPHNTQKCLSHTLQHNFFYLVWRSLEKKKKKKHINFYRSSMLAVSCDNFVILIVDTDTRRIFKGYTNRITDMVDESKPSLFLTHIKLLTSPPSPSLSHLVLMDGG